MQNGKEMYPTEEVYQSKEELQKKKEKADKVRAELARMREARRRRQREKDKAGWTLRETEMRLKEEKEREKERELQEKRNKVAAVKGRKPTEAVPVKRAQKGKDLGKKGHDMRTASRTISGVVSFSRAISAGSEYSQRGSKGKVEKTKEKERAEIEVQQGGIGSRSDEKATYSQPSIAQMERSGTDKGKTFQASELGKIKQTGPGEEMKEKRKEEAQEREEKKEVNEAKNIRLNELGERKKSRPSDVEESTGEGSKCTGVGSKCTGESVIEESDTKTNDGEGSDVAESTGEGSKCMGEGSKCTGESVIEESDTKTNDGEGRDVEGAGEGSEGSAGEESEERAGEESEERAAEGNEKSTGEKSKAVECEGKEKSKKVKTTKKKWRKIFLGCNCTARPVKQPTKKTRCCNVLMILLLGPLWKSCMKHACTCNCACTCENLD
ncbi:uncharacterized protein LOC143927263 [Lithobates pipiens]